MVILVHGTWGRRSAWTKPDSKLSVALTAAGCTVVSFTWSGRNSHRARALAARDLADHLNAEVAKSPRSRFWVVAHSHGGNVAVRAVAKLRQSRRRVPQISTIALATPFINSRARRPTRWLRFVLAMFGPLLLLAAAFRIWERPPPVPIWTPPDWVLIAAGCVAAVAGLLCVPGMIRHGGRRTRRELLDSTSAPAMGRRDLFIVRPAGDEASAALITGQFVGWIAGVLSRRLAKEVFWGVYTVLSLGTLLVSAAIKTGFGIYVLLYWWPLLGFALVVLMAVMLLASLGFGLDGPFVCMFAFCSAEFAPPGDATVLQLEPFAAASGGLAHARVYREEAVIRSVVDAVRGKAR